MKQEIDLEQRILEVAEKLFMEKGFAATKTTEIAAKAGCNHALIHYYFHTKENLFEKVFVNKFTVGMNQLKVELDGVTDIEQLTRKFIDRHLELVVKNQYLPLFLLGELNANPKRIELLRRVVADHPVFGDFFLKLQAILQLEHERGTIREIDAFNYMLNIVSLSIMSVVMLPIYAKATGIDRKAQREFIDMRREEITHLVLRGIMN